MKQQQEVRELFARVLGIPLEKVVDGLSYNGLLEWDSIAHMALIAALDQHFGIMLDTDDVIDLSSLKKAFEILRKYGVET